MNEKFKYSPLTEATYFILISLTTPLHGYGIMKRTAELSDNKVTLAPGTLYGALNVLLKKNYIEIAESSISSTKKKYIITPEGLNVLKNEISRLEKLHKLGIDTLGGN